MKRRLFAAGLPALLLAAGARAAPAAGGGTAYSVQLVRTGLYLISGPGGNSLLRLSAAGLILVNGQAEGEYRALMAQLRSVNRMLDLPLRVLVVTDADPARTGNLAQFAARGVALIAQQDARRRLADGEPAAAKAVAFDDSYGLNMGGVELRLLHMPHARTDGDAVVLFPAPMKVVVLGGLLQAGVPEPDVARGGSLAGWSAALAAVLKLDFDLAVPGVGALATRADVQACKARIDALLPTA